MGSLETIKFEYEFGKRLKDGWDEDSLQIETINIYQRGGGSVISAHGQQRSTFEVGKANLLGNSNDHMNVLVLISQTEILSEKSVEEMVKSAICDFADKRQLVEDGFGNISFEYSVKKLGGSDYSFVGEAKRTGTSWEI